MGRMTSHVVWKNNPNVPNHQPVGIGPAEDQNTNSVRRSTHHATVPMFFLGTTVLGSNLIERVIPYRDTPRTFLFIHFNSK